MLSRSIFNPFRASLRSTAPILHQSLHFPQPTSRLLPSKPPLTPRPSARHYASGSPFNRPRSQHSYNRFSNARAAAHLWNTSPLFRQATYLSAGGLAVFTFANIETVPESGRKRFNWVSPAYEREMGKRTYQAVLQQYQGQILPANHRSVRLAKKVVARLLPHSGLPEARDGGEWEVNVIQSDDVNAFVIPGGKVFVFTGILPICEDEQGLAAVLGHEIAHNIAHHSAENLSRVSFLLPFAWAAAYFLDVSGQLTFWVLDLAYNRPGSRKQESEADLLGLMMMSRACYDPQAALSMWRKMELVEKQMGGSVPGFLSTHPTNKRRIEDIGKWLPRAEESRDESGCGATGQWAEGFKSALPSQLGSRMGPGTTGLDNDWF